MNSSRIYLLNASRRAAQVRTSRNILLDAIGHGHCGVGSPFAGHCAQPVAVFGFGVEFSLPACLAGWPRGLV